LSRSPTDGARQKHPKDTSTFLIANVFSFQLGKLEEKVLQATLCKRLRNMYRMPKMPNARMAQHLLPNQSEMPAACPPEQICGAIEPNFYQCTNLFDQPLADGGCMI
jgi:hypothetical protein